MWACQCTRTRQKTFVVESGSLSLASLCLKTGFFQALSTTGFTACLTRRSYCPEVRGPRASAQMSPVDVSFRTASGKPEDAVRQKKARMSSSDVPSGNVCVHRTSIAFATENARRCRERTKRFKKSQAPYPLRKHSRSSGKRRANSSACSDRAGCPPCPPTNDQWKVAFGGRRCGILAPKPLRRTSGGALVVRSSHQWQMSGATHDSGDAFAGDWSLWLDSRRLVGSHCPSGVRSWGLGCRDRASSPLSPP